MSNVMYDLRTASDDGVLMSFGILETFYKS